MKSKFPEKAEDDNCVMSENGISTSIEPGVGVTSGEVNKVLEEEPDSLSHPGVSNLPSKIPQGSLNPVKSETVHHIFCPDCKEEIPKNIFTKHFLTHNNRGANTKAKTAKKMQSSFVGEVSKPAEVQTEDDNSAGPKVKGKKKVIDPEEEEAAEVSSDFLNVTCPLPIASPSSPSEKDEKVKGKKTSVRMKRSRSISTIEKPQGPKKAKKTNIEESSGPSLATSDSKRKEPAKRGRKKKTN